MILYHGSNTDIINIDLTKCKPYKNFGKGFYLTDIKEQAFKMANRVAKIYGGIPIVNIYEIENDFQLKNFLSIKNFGKKTTAEWATFVMNNRNKNFQDIQNLLCNKDCKYDIVIGPVADDNMALLFRQFENELIDFQTLLNGMIYKETSSQYSFHTQRAAELLNKIGISK